MATTPQPLDQRAADRAGGAGDEHAQASGPRWTTVFRRALCSGTVAALASTVAISALARRRTGSAASGTNASSHWLWRKPARHARGVSLRYTATGFLIHHASACFWAAAFERISHGARGPAQLVPRAAAVSVMAWLVDYHVVPKRLNPGFESRVRRSDLVPVYAAFAAGLAATALSRGISAHRAAPRVAPPARRAAPPPPATRRG